MASTPLLNSKTRPDQGVYPSPYSVFSTNGLNDPSIYVFPDGSADITLNGVFKVESDYSSDAEAVISWTSQATTGDVEWVFAYNTSAVGETFDPASATETVNVAGTAPASTDLRVDTTLTLTDGNFTIGDLIPFRIIRKLSDVGDTMSDNALLFDAVFNYTAA